MLKNSIVFPKLFPNADVSLRYLITFLIITHDHVCIHMRLQIKTRYLSNYVIWENSWVTHILDNLHEIMKIFHVGYYG